jgi:hypothetical protein
VFPPFEPLPFVAIRYDEISHSISKEATQVEKPVQSYHPFLRIEHNENFHDFFKTDVKILTSVKVKKNNRYFIPFKIHDLIFNALE